MADDSDGEWFDIYNTTRNDITMCGGWVISDGGVDSHTIASEVTIAAGDYGTPGDENEYCSIET